MKLPSSKVRMYLYGVITAAVAVLVALKIIDPGWCPCGSPWPAPCWPLGTGTATVTVAKQRSNGILDD